MKTGRTVDAGAVAGLDVKQLPGLLHGRDDIHGRVERMLDPLAWVLSLWIAAFVFDPDFGTQYLILTLGVAMLTFPGRSRLHVAWGRLVADIVAYSATLLALLIFFGWATRYLQAYPRAAVLNWLWLAPLCLVATHLAFRLGAPLILTRTQRCIIVGLNDQGIALAARISDNPYTDLALVGFFDDRSLPRREGKTPFEILGRFDDVAGYADANRVHVIYLSLPMATHERTIRLLDALRDTTASIYFVPDQFVTELIQGRMSAVVDIPVVAVCETPFVGLNGVLKRSSDVTLSFLGLVALAPILLTIALLVRLDSPGPTIFRQRRYGLDGREITVYKFRSMRVSEKGAPVLQARRNDLRVTRLGAFLRRTSLDELPQLVNVLQGRMSLVGPRPHAVDHNEQYRKLIKGYMVRHKVRPGITGWAQVNGLRGETDTVEKMAARIRFDLDYLRNWSLRLDLHILLKTFTTVLRHEQAY